MFGGVSKSPSGKTFAPGAIGLICCTKRQCCGSVKKLTAYEDRYRLRIGDYRVIYDVMDEQLVILVVGVGHRREIYRAMSLWIRRPHSDYGDNPSSATQERPR